MAPSRIIIAGGGTGGHIFPAVAIGHALQRLAPDTELLFVGAANRMEMEKIPQEGFNIIGLDIAGYNRSSVIKNIMLPLKLWRSLRAAKKIIADFRADAAVGVGGYASFPVLRAAQKTGIPSLIQEQNSFAGRSNKILGRRADKVCVAYDGMEEFFPKKNLVLTGNPVRKAISDAAITKDEGLDWAGLKPTKKTILIVGGSLGAKSINEAVDAGLEALLAEDVNIIWQTGKPYYDAAAARVKGLEDRVKVYEFIRQMAYGYAAADLVISRAGALAIAELCIVGKPVIFVPYPLAAEDHQTSNAMALVKHNAAQIVKDNEAKSTLIKKTIALLHDYKAQTIMHEALQSLAIRDADERIATEILNLN